MKQLTPIEKLDEVLSIISSVKSFDNPTITFEGIYQIINERKIAFSAPDMQRVLMKLENDKYVICRMDKRNPTDIHLTEHYFSTFDGDLFIQNNGYNEEQKRLSTLQFRKSLSNTLIVAGTIGAALGTIFLFLWEFWKANKEHPDWF